MCKDPALGMEALRLYEKHGHGYWKNRRGDDVAAAHCPEPCAFLKVTSEQNPI